MSISMSDILPIGLLPDVDDSDVLIIPMPEYHDDGNGCKGAPRLPMELMNKIIKIVHQDLKVSVHPFTLVSHACNELATPLLYETIPLTPWTLEKLPACILASPSDTEVLQDSHDRKVKAFEKTTTFIIEDIPVLFYDEFDFALKKFCKKVVLPNAKSVIWRQLKAWKWQKSYHGRAPRDFRKPIMGSWDVKNRADMFRSVLPAKDKNICVQVPKSGLFQHLGPKGTTPHRHIWTQRYSVRTFDRIMEYISVLPGRSNLHIHQPTSNRYISFAWTPATYSFYRVDGGFRDTRDALLGAYSKTVFHHSMAVLQLHPHERWSNLFEDVYQVLESTVLSRAEQRQRGQALLLGWTKYWKRMPRISFREIHSVLLRDFYQMAAVLEGEGRSRCACCEGRKR